MKTHPALFVCLWLSVLLSGPMRGADAAKVGVLGSASHLEFEGNTTFSAQRLYQGLHTHGDWLQAAHPEAPLVDYVKATQAALLRGYQRAGFPHAQIIETRWLTDPRRLLCVITEGQRYKAGPVIVTGAQAVPAAQIVEKLTTVKKKPGDLFTTKDKPEEKTSPPSIAVASETTAPGISLKTKTQLDESTQTESKNIAWEIGKPAALDARRPVELKEIVVNQFSQAGRMQARMEVKTVLDDATHTAALHVEILSEGPPAVLAGITCTGLKRDSEAALLKHLGLEKGRPFMSGQVQEIENRLLESARYISYKVTATPRKTDQPEMDLKLELVEMPEAPRLGEALNATYDTLLKARDWLIELLRTGSEDVLITIEHQPDPGHRGQLDLIYNSLRGLHLTLTVFDGGEERKNPRRCTLRYTPEEVCAYFSAHAGTVRQWLRQPAGKSWKANMFVTIDADEGTDKKGSNNSIKFGGSWNDTGGDGLIHLAMTMKPAAALLQSLKHGNLWSSQDGLLTMKSQPKDKDEEPDTFIIEEATGRVRGAGNGKGNWNKDHTEFSRFSMTTARGAWEKATLELEAQTAGLPNIYAEGGALGAWAGWLTAGALNSGIGKTAALTPEETTRRVDAARELGRRLGLSVPEFYSAFDSGEDAFFVPDTPDKPRIARATTTLVAQMGLTVVDFLFKEGSWPWLLAREVYYSTTGHNEFTGRILQQVMQDPQLGPMGCYFAAVLLDWTLPASAGDFRDLALKKMTAADFRKDWGLLVGSSTPRQRTAMTELLEKMRAGGQNPELDLLRELSGTAEAASKLGINASLDFFLKELRREPSRPLADAMATAMDKMWDETLSGILRDKLAPKGSDGKAVDAVRVAALVGGTEITRREMMVAMDLFRKEITNGSAADKEAEVEQAALKSQIEVALLHAAFKAMGNSFKPEQMDEDLRQYVARNFKGSQARFLQQLTQEGVTLDEFRMIREKNLVASLLRQKIRDMTPAPTEQEITREMEKHRLPPERQVKLRTLSIPKQFKEQGEAQQRKLADDLLAKLKEGLDFAALAKKHSADSRAADGGAMDWINPAGLSPVIAKPLAGMKPGEISGMVDIGSAWIIVKFDQERTLDKAPAEQRKEAAALLLQQRATEFYNNWLNNVRGQIKVQVLPKPEPKAGK